jgi:hypothetical protein
MTAPVQVLVLGFEAPTFTGEVLAELHRLREAGVVRLVDVLLVAREADGSFHTLPPPDGSDPDLGRLAAGLVGVLDGDDGPAEAGEGDTWSLADVVPPGSTGAVALIEHTWAVPLVSSVRGAGGRLLDEAWLAPSDVERLRNLTSP